MGEPPDWLKLLEKIGQLSEEAVEVFTTTRVLPRYELSFRRLDASRRQVIVALDSLSNKELKAMWDYQDSELKQRDIDAYIVGVHRVRTPILLLGRLTERNIEEEK